MLKHQAEPVLYRDATENVIPEVIADYTNVQNQDAIVRREAMVPFIAILMQQNMQEKPVIRYAVFQDVTEEHPVEEVIATNTPALCQAAIRKE